MHQYVGILGGIVVDLANLDFPLFEGLENRIDNGCGGLAVRNFGDGKRLVVDFLDFGADANHSSALAVVVAAHVDETAGGEIRI